MLRYRYQGNSGVAYRLTLITTIEKEFKPCNRETEEGRALSRRSEVAVGVLRRARRSKVASQSSKLEALSGKFLSAEKR